MQVPIFSWLVNGFNKVRDRGVGLTTTLTAPADWFVNIFGSQTKARQAVNQQTALKLSAFYAGVRTISETIGTIPFSVMERDGKGSKAARYDHPVYNLIHNQPNPYMTAMVFWETVMVHVILWGNAYALIHRDGKERPYALELKMPYEVTPVVFDGQLYYNAPGVDHSLAPIDVLHIPGLGFDGIQGKSVVSVARESLGAGLSQQDFQSEFYGHGSHPGYVVEVPGTLKPEAAARLKTSFEDKVKNHGMLPLDGGMKLHKLGMPQTDAQFIETRQFTVEEMARWLNLPPHKLRKMDKSSFNNIESEQISFVTDSIRPWVIRIEQELNRKLFYESEKSRIYTKGNIDALLRGDLLKRYQAYALGRQWGWLATNDILRKEDMNPIAGGDDDHLTPLNMVKGDQVPADELKNLINTSDPNVMDLLRQIVDDNAN